MSLTENKRSCYNNSAVHPSIFNRKKKIGNFKKRKKKYRKSVIGKGINIASQDYNKGAPLPDSTHAFISTQYFHDNQSCEVPDETGFVSEFARGMPNSNTHTYMVSVV